MLFNLAVSHTRLGDDFKALKLLSEAIMLDPDFVPALKNRALIHRRQVTKHAHNACPSGLC